MKNTLFTGYPGVGKSTLIQKVVSRYKGPATGFLQKKFGKGGNGLVFPSIRLKGNNVSWRI